MSVALRYSLSFAFVALVITSFRLAVRGPRRWGWDDLFASLAAGAFILQAIVLLLRVDHVPYFRNNLSAALALYYMNGLLFPIVTWSSRLSVLQSLVRIEPTLDRRRRLHILSLIFSIIIVIQSILFPVACATKPGWQKLPAPVCPVPRVVPIFQIVTVICADIVLIIIPYRIFDVLRSDRLLRYRLKLIFSSTILLTLAGIAHAVVTLRLGGIAELFAALTEECVSILICNLTIIVTAIIQLFKFSTSISSTSLSSSQQQQSHILFRPTASSSNGRQPPSPYKISFMSADADDAVYNPNSYALHQDPTASTAVQVTVEPGSGFLSRWRSLDVDSVSRRDAGSLSLQRSNTNNTTTAVLVHKESIAMRDYSPTTKSWGYM